MNLHSYSPATDTHELARVYRGPWFDAVTVEIPRFELPPVTTVYRTPHARARRAGRRFLASEFVADVRARLPRIPIAVGGLLVGYVLMQVMGTIVLVAS